MARARQGSSTPNLGRAPGLSRKLLDRRRRGSWWKTVPSPSFPGRSAAARRAFALPVRPFQRDSGALYPGSRCPSSMGGGLRQASFRDLAGGGPLPGDRQAREWPSDPSRMPKGGPGENLLRDPSGHLGFLPRANRPWIRPRCRGKRPGRHAPDRKTGRSVVCSLCGDWGGAGSWARGGLSGAKMRSRGRAGARYGSGEVRDFTTGLVTSSGVCRQR